MDALRLVSLGGFNNVTGNMFAYHFLPNGKEERDQILIVDCGVSFPNADIFGVDLIIPDTSYLKSRKEKIIGVVLTHGHEDHFGALSFILPDLPQSLPIFASRLTASLALGKLEELGIKTKISIFNRGDQIKLGNFLISPVGVTHSLPDTFHLFIETPVGNFYHGSDFKFDLTPPDKILPQLDKISNCGKRGVLALLSDCLGAEKEGFSPSESTLNKMFEEEIRRAKGRVFITAISSNIYRWQEAIESSRKFGRKISLIGFSIKRTVEVAKELKYLDLGKDEIIDFTKAVDLPPKRVTFLIAGSLGQSGSSLEKVVLGKHKVKIKKGDKVIFSSPDYIPGTGRAIYQLIDVLISQGANVVYGESEENLHVSGHAYRQEMRLLINLTSPKYLVPIGGERRHVFHYANLAKEMGYHDKEILISDDGATPTFWSDGKADLSFQYRPRQVLIDGLGIGDVGKTVLRDRNVLAKNGMIVIIILVDSKDGRMVDNPEVVSRGFVYLKENKKLLGQINEAVRRVYQREAKPVFNLENIRFQIQSSIESFVYQKTGREPMVLPVIIEI